jgi:hypothetical protein
VTLRAQIISPANTSKAKLFTTALRNKSLSITETLEISIQAAEAISAAHAAGIIIAI